MSDRHTIRIRQKFAQLLSVYKIQCKIRYLYRPTRYARVCPSHTRNYYTWFNSLLPP